MSSVFRGWVRVLSYGFGVKDRKVKSHDCALASDRFARVAPAPRAKLEI